MVRRDGQARAKLRGSQFKLALLNLNIWQLKWARLVVKEQPEGCTNKWPG
jgi:hypothetical protein